MAYGTLTTRAARALATEFDPDGFDVLYGHGRSLADPADRLGKLKSWFGRKYQSDAILADLDLPVVSRQSGKAYALIEIEETTDKPKVLLGDILATLLGSRITFQGKRRLQVGAWTILIVLAYSKGRVHRRRLAFVQRQANLLKGGLNTPNAHVGRIVVDSFRDEADLAQKLRQLIKSAVGPP